MMTNIFTDSKFREFCDTTRQNLFLANTIGCANCKIFRPNKFCSLLCPMCTCNRQQFEVITKPLTLTKNYLRHFAELMKS